MAGSYVNFYIGNGFVVMPKYGCPEDGLAREILQSHLPDREVIAVEHPLHNTAGTTIVMLERTCPDDGGRILGR
jgi:agmatine/peptidylarginine deiminase